MALHAFAVCHNTGQQTGDAKGTQLDDLVLRIQRRGVPVAHDGGCLQQDRQQDGTRRSAPAKQQARQHKWQDIEVVQNVVQHHGMRRHDPRKHRQQYDHRPDSRRLNPARHRARRQSLHTLILPRSRREL